MFSLIITIISIAIFTAIIASISYYAAEKLGENSKSDKLNLKKDVIEFKNVTNEMVLTPKIEMIEQQPVKNVNIYEFKNAETVIYPILALLILFFVFKKFNIITIKVSSFINTIKTKRILKKINQLNSEQIFDITNISEVQILKNTHLLNLNKNAVELSTYNDLLVSKHNSIIEKISH